MKATIWAHEALPEGHEEIHRFGFELQDGSERPPVREFISLRTARAIVAHLEDGNAFVAMLRAIVSTEPSVYGALVGKSFADRFVMDGPGDRSPERSRGYKNAQPKTDMRRTKISDDELPIADG